MVLSGHSKPLTKDQIVALQAVYMNILHQVYLSARATLLKLLKEVKPSTFLDIQGVLSAAGVSNDYSQIPKLVLQDLFTIVSLQDQGSQNGLTTLTSKSNGNILSQGQLMNSLASKMNSYRPSMNSNAQKGRPKNPESEHREEDYQTQKV